MLVLLSALRLLLVTVAVLLASAAPLSRWGS
jgi:hypothetical protein